MQISRLLNALTWRGLICMFLATSTAIGPSLEVWAQQPTTPADSKPKAAAASAPYDTKYVAPSAAGFIALRPAQIMKSPFGELLPIEVATAAGLKFFNIDPANVEEISGCFDIINIMSPNVCLAVKFLQPFDTNNLPERLRAHTQPDKLGSKPYLKSTNPIMPSLYMPDNRTLLIANEALIQTLVESSGAGNTSPLLERVRSATGGNDLYVALDIATLRPLIQMGIGRAAEKLPPDVRQYLAVINLMSTAELTVNLSKAAPSSLVVQANDEAAANKIEMTISDASARAREQMKARFAEMAKSNDPVEKAYAKYLERISEKWSQPLMPKREGARLTFFHVEGSDSPQRQLTIVAIIGIVVALLLPATQAARAAARRNTSINNMRQIMIALQNFHDTRRVFPAHAAYSEDGKAMLSWRVAILPFIEELDLYNQFHLDEPWDSEHNRALIARMPDTFKNPSLDLPQGKTTYLGVVGKGCVFDGSPNGLRLQQITDGTSKTIMAVEADANKAVEWTKPDDWQYDPKKPMDGLGHVHPGGWLAAFCDAHISFIRNDVSVETLK